MISCLDVYYRETEATVACLTFLNWSDALPHAEVTITISPVEPYISGQFYKRELPCLLKALHLLPQTPDYIVIDGYVWLHNHTSPGLGAYLFESLGAKSIIIGVAKTKFIGSNVDETILRGESKTPLFITSAGLPVKQAAELIRAMHGPFRIPTLLKYVDRLSRSN